MTALGRTSRLACVALLVASTVGEAQTATGTIRGYVRDQSGAPVGDANVILRDVAMGTTRSAATNASGFYNIGGLRPASYEFSVRRLGFTAVSRTVQVGIGQTLTYDVQLSQAAAQLSAVVVTADVGATSKTSESGTNVSREQIQNLPNFERNFLDIARLAPGITPQNVNDDRKILAAAGQPAEAVNIFIDGATFKSDVLPGGVAGQDASKGNPFPQDAVQEFRVITQNFKAEYQKAGSAIITATTRSGSNDFELGAFAYTVNRNLVSRDAFSESRNLARPTYERWQAGLSAGGPIQRDRLFWFATYELNDRTEPGDVRLGPDSTLAPAAIRSLLVPYTGQFSNQFREHLGFGKVTWVPSSRHTVDGSLSVRMDRDFRGFGGQTSYEARENLDIDVYTGIGNWRYSGDRWLNEAQVSGQHFSWNPTWINGDLIGRNYEQLLRIGGKDTQQDFDQRRLSLRNDVTRSGIQAGGDHVFKFGGNVDFLDYQAVKAFTLNPVFLYRRDEQWAQPYRAQFGFGDPDVSMGNTQFGFYAQDDWSIGQRLVLNLGIRWDAETNMINNDYVTPQPLADSLRGPLNSQLFVRQVLPDPSNPSGSRTQNVRTIDMIGGVERFISTGDNRKMYKKAFQPRLGASFDVFGTGSTVLFGGYGVYFDRTFWNRLLDEQFRRQFGVYTVDFRSSAAACAAETDVTVRARCTTWNEGYFEPAQLRTLTGSIGLPEVFMVPNDLTPPSTRQFNAGVRQAVGPTLVSLSYTGVRGRNYLNYIRAAYTIGPQSLGAPGATRNSYAAVFIGDDRVKTWYDALSLQIEKPLRAISRWGGSVAYTLGRSEEQGQSTDSFWGFDEQYPTVADRPRRRAPGDQRHRVVANGVFRLPAEIVFSTIVNLGSGITENARDETEGTGPFQAVTYPFTPPGRPFLGIGQVFATQQVDLRLEVPVRFQGQRVSLVADAFNAFNNRNYGCFDARIAPRGQTNANFGKPGCAGLGPRLQLGARYSFRESER